MAYDPFAFPLPNFGAASVPSFNLEADYQRRRAMAEASGAARPGGLLSLNSAVPAPGATSFNSPLMPTPTKGRLESAGPELNMNSLSPESGKNPWANYGDMFASMLRGLTPSAPATPATPSAPLPGLGAPPIPPSMFQGAVSAPFTPPPVVPLPGLGGSDSAGYMANRNYATAADASLDRNKAIRDEAARLSAAGAAQNTDAILGDAEAANRRLGAVVAGRSPDGAFINPQNPVMTAQQARGMGLNYNYGGAVPAGFELVGGNLRRAAAPTTMIEGDALAKANAELKRDIPRVALPPLPQMEQRRGGQAAGETAEQYDQRLADIRAARASRSPVSLSSGGERKFGDTYSDQKNFREGREAELAIANARFMPTPVQQSRIDRNTAYIESVRTRASQLQGKARLDFYNDQLGQIAKRKTDIGRGEITDPDGSVLRGLIEAEGMLKAEIANETGAAVPPPLPTGTPPPPKTTAAGDTAGAAESFLRGGAAPAAGATPANYPPGTKEKENKKTGQRIFVTPSGEVFDAKTGSRIQ